MNKGIFFFFFKTDTRNEPTLTFEIYSYLQVTTLKK